MYLQTNQKSNLSCTHSPPALRCSHRLAPPSRNGAFDGSIVEISVLPVCLPREGGGPRSGGRRAASRYGLA